MVGDDSTGVTLRLLVLKTRQLEEVWAVVRDPDGRAVELYQREGRP